MIPNRDVYAYRTTAQRFDVGTPLGMLKASVHSALTRDDMAEEFGGWLRDLLSEDAP
jgi:UTP-glucose-1-phosphate uridylyltransferase